MNEGLEWGGGSDLSAVEGVMWRADNDPRTRATGSMFERLDQVPDWPGFLAAHERGTRMVPRLRERIVEPLLPLVQPAWSLDPHFDLEHHVYRVQVLSPGTERQLAEMVEALFRRPLDRTRPPWEAVLLTGLPGGRAAYLLRTHHVLGDGLALVQLMDMLHSQQALPGHGEVAQFPGRPTVTASSLLTSRLARQAKGAPWGAVKQTIAVNTGALHTMLRPWRSTKDSVDYLLSLQRKLSTEGPRSPLLQGQGGIGCRVAFAQFPHAQMRAAGKVAGGSVNDVYIAGMIGALRLFHEHHGVRVEQIPVSIPISLRKASDPLGGNRFTGATFMAPLGEHDPVRRIQLVRDTGASVPRRAGPGLHRADRPHHDAAADAGHRRDHRPLHQRGRRPADQHPGSRLHGIPRRCPGHAHQPHRPEAGGGDDGRDDDLRGQSMHRDESRSRRLPRCRPARRLRAAGLRRGSLARAGHGT